MGTWLSGGSFNGTATALVYWTYTREPEPSPVPSPPEPSAPELFQEMMQVLSNPRWANCHGALDVFAPGGNTTPAGSSRRVGNLKRTLAAARGNNAVYATPASPSRRRRPSGGSRSMTTPPDGKAKLPRRSAALCFSGRAEMVDHLREETCVALGFEGLRGGAATQAEPPGMTLEEFLDLTARWVAASESAPGVGEACPG